VLNPARRVLFSKMPLALVRLLAYLPTVALWAMLKLGIRPIAYLKLLSRFPFMHLHHIVFDQMLPQTACYWTRKEALALLQRVGLKDIQIY
jgi:hypothetical protein